MKEVVELPALKNFVANRTDKARFVLRRWGDGLRRSSTLR